MKMKQQHIINLLNVEAPYKEETRDEFIKRLIDERCTFLKDYLATTPAKGYVLGISGGVDSFVVSMLTKHAGLELVSISIPYGIQKDMEDVMASVNIINPDKFITHDIMESVDAQLREIGYNYDLKLLSEPAFKLMKGNIMARERMAVQYSYGSIYNYLVLGSDHATEAVTGFYTKWGDGAADVIPLSGLTKDIIYDMAKYFNGPEKVISKAPSAGLWDNQTDEDELGLKYSDICSYLQGNEISNDSVVKIEKIFDMTEHKRHMPADIYSDWWEHRDKENTTVIVVDAQNDFISGALACEHSEEAVENIIKYLNNHTKLNVVYTRDYHSKDHCSFINNGGTWPEHCVMNTWGAEIHSKFDRTLTNMLQQPGINIGVFYKGMDKDKEEYSGYDSNRIGRAKTIKMNENIHRDVIVCGIATEFCVKETVLDLLKNGFNVSILKDGLGYITEEGNTKTLEELEKMGVKII